jgi:hypothetical protein
MTQEFRLVALPVEAFAHLFDRSDAELAAHGARRCIADAKPGFPCRVSLVDAEPGEPVLLLPFTHHDTPSPFVPLARSSCVNTRTPRNSR